MRGLRFAVGAGHVLGRVFLVRPACPSAARAAESLSESLARAPPRARWRGPEPEEQWEARFRRRRRGASLGGASPRSRGNACEARFPL